MIDDCFTILISVIHQHELAIGPLPLEPPFHLPFFLTPLVCDRAPVWVPSHTPNFPWLPVLHMLVYMLPWNSLPVNGEFVSFYCVKELHFYPFISWWTFYFQILARFINNANMKIWAKVFSGNIYFNFSEVDTSSGIAGYVVKSVSLTFLRTCLFSKMTMSFYIHTSKLCFELFHIFANTWNTVGLFDYRYSNDVS